MISSSSRPTGTYEYKQGKKARMMTMMQFNDIVKFKTNRVVFEDVFSARDSATLEQLKELSAKRRAIEESINGTSCITEAVAREMSGGLTSRSQQDLQKLEQYLPLLENLVRHIDSVSDREPSDRWVSQLNIRWSSNLSSSFDLYFVGTNHFPADNLRYELGMNLFLYGAKLRERAFEVFSADLTESALLLRKAAGVFDYLASEVFLLIQPRLPPKRSPEATIHMPFVMSLICLAEAQAVITKKAEGNQTSVGLLAKLHYGIVQFLDDASLTMHSRFKGLKNVSKRLVDYVSSSRSLHELRSNKYLAESHKLADQLGVAVGVLSGTLTNVQKKMPGEQSWRLVFKMEVEDVSAMLKKYENENAFIMREKIPSPDELPPPEGKKIVSPVPYQPERWERELALNMH